MTLRTLTRALRRFVTRNATRRTVCNQCRCAHREDRHA